MSKRQTTSSRIVSDLMALVVVALVGLVPATARAESAPLSGEVAELWSERPRGEDTLVITAVDASGRPRIVTRDGIDTTGEVAAVVAAADRLPGEATTEWDGTARITLANDPLRTSQWGHDVMSVESSWSSATGEGIVVAVIDSGVSAHPDLAGNLLPGRDFVDGDVDASDAHGHGTHVAGIIAASADNGIGVAGAAPRAKILPLRVLDANGTGSWSSVASAVTWAADNGAHVINLSLGGTTRSTAVAAAINYATSKNVVVVVAAGNDGTTAAPSWPAAEENVLAVAATNAYGSVASFSSRGSYVDVAAAGEGINSTLNTGGYGYMSGTSMASPYAAALAALVRQANPALTESQVRSRIQSTAVDMAPTGPDTSSGHGQIDFALAVPPIPWNAPAPLNPTVTIAGLDLAVSASPVTFTGVIGYELLRNGAVVATAPTPSFVDSSRATFAGTYSYEIRAYNAFGQRSAGAQTTFAVVPPGVPALAASVLGTSATLTPTAVGSAAVGGWMVYRNGALVTSTTSTAPVVISGLPVGNHSFAVRAMGTSGVSGLSGSVSVQVYSPAPSISVSRSGIGLVVTSSAVDGATRYQFTRNGVEVAYVTERTYLDITAALVPGPVTYGVRALAGGIWTNVATVTFTVAPPAVPQVSSATVGNDVRLDVVAPGATELLVYRDGTLNRTVPAAPSVTLSAMATTPAAWSVRAANTSGVSAMSNVVTIAGGIPAPAAISVSRRGTDLVVRASSVTGARTYELYQNGTQIARTASRSPEFSVRDGATVSGSVLYQVRAVTSTGLRSAPASTTWHGQIPAAPSVSAVLSGSTVTLTVNAPGVTELLVYRNWSLVTTRAVTTSIVLTNEPFGPNVYTVRAATAQGVSPHSTPISLTLAAPTPVPTISVDRTDVLVQVAPVSGATNYQFFRNGVLVQSGSWPRLYDVNRATIAGTYTYDVVARQRSGASTPTGTGAITITPPAAPTITGTGGRRAATITVSGWKAGDRVAIYSNGSLVWYGPAVNTVVTSTRRGGTYSFTARIVSPSGTSAMSAPITVTTSN